MRRNREGEKRYRFFLSSCARTSSKFYASLLKNPTSATQAIGTRARGNGRVGDVQYGIVGREIRTWRHARTRNIIVSAKVGDYANQAQIKRLISPTTKINCCHTFVLDAKHVNWHARVILEPGLPSLLVNRA